jgi:hypothetical protein
MVESMNGGVLPHRQSLEKEKEPREADHPRAHRNPELQFHHAGESISWRWDREELVPRVGHETAAALPREKIFRLGVRG